MNSRKALGLCVKRLNHCLKVLAFHVLHFNGLMDVLKHLVHHLHLLAHRLHLLFSSLKRRGFVVRLKELGVNSLGKPLGHFLRARPVHVLDEQVASHGPKSRVALKKLRHGVKRFLTLGHVARPGRDAHIVLANAGVVDFFNYNVGVFGAYNLLDRLLLRRVNLSHVRFTVDADDAGDALGVVDLWNHVYDLARRVANGAGKVVNVVICACIALFFASQNSPA